MTKEKLLKNKKILIIGICIFVSFLITIIVAYIVSTSKKKNLSEFEKITIYGYLEDFLTPSKLRYLSGNSNLDELQYTQIYVKKAIDNYISTNNTDIIPVSAITAELAQNNLLENTNIDFHGVAIPDYIYSIEENAYVKSPGANGGLTFIDSNSINMSELNDKTTVTGIEKLKDNKYKIFFNLIDITTSSNSGNGDVIVKIVDDSKLEIESCNFNN